jgi:hypothetical protein
VLRDPQWVNGPARPSGGAGAAGRVRRPGRCHGDDVRSAAPSDSSISRIRVEAAARARFARAAPWVMEPASGLRGRPAARGLRDGSEGQEGATAMMRFDLTDLGPDPGARRQGQAPAPILLIPSRQTSTLFAHDHLLFWVNGPARPSGGAGAAGRVRRPGRCHGDDAVRSHRSSDSSISRIRVEAAARARFARAAPWVMEPASTTCADGRVSARPRPGARSSSMPGTSWPGSSACARRCPRPPPGRGSPAPPRG